MNTQKKDKKYLGRDSIAGMLSIAKTKGSYVYDEHGKKYIDFFMGWSVGSIGWGQKEIIKAIKKFDGPTYVSPGYFYKGWSDLAELLAKIAPGKLVKSFRATGGTEAVEIALQAAMCHTKRKKFVSIEGSYHGHSIGAMSVGSSDFRSWYKNLLPDCHKIKAPLNEKAGHAVERLLSKGDIAAFISEPIVCNLGVVIPDKKFFDIVQKACKKYGTLFVADEVATGFGHTGKVFACEHFNIEPDILCIAKAVGGGFGAIGATMMTSEVAKSFEFDFSFYSTFGWHPLNVEATIVALKYFIKHKKALLSNANTLSRYFETRIRNMKFKYPFDLKIRGLTIGIEFNRIGYGSKIIETCLSKGLLIANAGATNIVIYPALNMDMKTAEKGLDILESCL